MCRADGSASCHIVWTLPDHFSGLSGFLQDQAVVHIKFKRKIVLYNVIKLISLLDFKCWSFLFSSKRNFLATLAKIVKHYLNKNVKLD
jgi:hypothetical protein